MFIIIQIQSFKFVHKKLLISTNSGHNISDFLFDLRVFNNSLLGKEKDSNLVIILHVLVLQKKRKNTSGQNLSNELCVHAFVTKIGHNCGIEEAGKRYREGGKKYHIDTHSHPAVLQR